ncbi:hypothetical protein DFH06DRAFT_1023614, partial [Mycena polygramma]
MSRFRSNAVVNVVLGERIPRPDRGEAEKDRWCRAMMILFKPWRSLLDLKGTGESWAAAFDRTDFGPGAVRIMANMNVENECKDARDKYEVLRRSGKVKSMMPGHDGARSTDIESLTTALERDTGL